MLARVLTRTTPRRFDGLHIGAALLVAAPVLIDLAVSARSRVFGYLAADAFYYLTVGRSFADHGVLAYDQVHPTNGYHPLWQLVVAALFVIARLFRFPDGTVLFTVVVLGAFLLSAATWLLLGAARRGGEPPGAGTWSIPLGAYSVAILPIWILGGRATYLDFEGNAPLYGTMWSYANGMESALLLALWGVVASHLATGPLGGPRAGALFGVWLGLFTLARLDHGVFAVSALALLAWQRTPRGAWLAATATWLALLVMYLALNGALVGQALPVSGALKSSFPFATLRNWDDIRRLLSGAAAPWFPSAIRAAQMLLPAAVASGFLIGTRPRDTWSRLLCAWAWGVLALATYGFFYVPMYNQWHWNYPVSTLFVGVVAARALDRWIAGRPRLAAPVVALTLAASVAVFAGVHRRTDYHRNYATFYYETARGVRAEYAGHEPRIVEFDDGIVAFATGFPALSGTGLALDPEAAHARSRGRLLPLARARGHERITTLVYAPDQSRAVASGDPVAARQYARRLAGLEAARFDFVLDYAAPDGSFAILRFAPRRAPAAAP
jgi:hypothetical protein